jgi:hypothetical protein
VLPGGVLQAVQGDKEGARPYPDLGNLKKTMKSKDPKINPFGWGQFEESEAWGLFEEKESVEKGEHNFKMNHVCNFQMKYKQMKYKQMNQLPAKGEE